MQIKLSGHHVEITPALHDYVHDKLERIERHFDSATSAQVILSVEKLRQKAEATIHVAGNELFADAVDDEAKRKAQENLDHLKALQSAL